MKKIGNTSKRAMTELLSSGTDNNKDARWRNAEVKDKREELKKDLFESNAVFGDSAFEKSESKKDIEAPEAKKAQVQKSAPMQDGNGAKTVAAGERISRGVAEGQRPMQGRPSSADALNKGESVRFEKTRPVDGKAAPAGANRPMQGRNPADANRPVQGGVKAPVDGTVRTAQGMGPSADAARQSARTPAKKRNGGKIFAVSAVLVSLLIVAAVAAFVYLYVNRDDGFIPVDVVAGNISPETSGYSEIPVSETEAYVTDGRYSVKFTFYEKPEIVCTTTEITVGELMNKLGITMDENNRCSMTSETVLSADSTVDIQTITYETVKKEESIPFETQYIDVRTIPKGTTKVSESGKNGVKTYTYKCTMVNGVEESRELVSEAVTTKPKSKVMYRGIGGTITSQGKTYKYSYYIDVKATVYNIVGTTASGLPTGTNVMAVDPRVIPLGTKCVVVGGGDYGYRIAADTGGNIKGNKIDLWYPAGTFNGFGWRNTRVYILE